MYPLMHGKVSLQIIICKVVNDIVHNLGVPKIALNRIIKNCSIAGRLHRSSFSIFRYITHLLVLYSAQISCRDCVHQRPSSLNMNLFLNLSLKSREVAMASTEPVRVPICTGEIALDYANSINCTEAIRN